MARVDDILAEWGRATRKRHRARLPHEKRKIRTWRCGEVGMEGTRLVLPGGTFTVCGDTYQSDRLLSFVGEIIYFHDDDPTGHELRYDPAFPGGVQRSIAIGLCIWHANGRVSMETQPHLGRAWQAPPSK